MQGSARFNVAFSQLSQRCQLAYQHVQNREWALAETLLRENIQEQESHSESWALLGLVAYHRQENANSKHCYERSLHFSPDQPQVLYNLAFTHLALNDPESAIQVLKRSLELAPDSIQFGLMLSRVYLQGRRFDEAHSLLHRLLKKWPTLESLQELMAVLYDHMGKKDKAKKEYESLLKKFPKNVSGCINLGKIYALEGEYAEAWKLFDVAASVEPCNPHLLNNLGNLCLMENRRKEAKIYFQKSLEQDPNLIVSKTNWGLTELADGDYDQAAIHLMSAYEQLKSSDDVYLFGKAVVGLALIHQHRCDWKGSECIQKDLQRVVAACIAKQVQPLLTPLQTMMLDLDLDKVKKLTQYFADTLQSDRKKVRSSKKSRRSEIIKLGYLSGDFGDHAVGLLLDRLLSYHDRNQFSVTAYSLKAHHDHYSEIIFNSVDRHLDLSKRSEREASAMILQDELDILVDLSGHTENAKPGLLIHRLAPIMIHWLGYPGTLAMPEVQYYLTHPLHVPPEFQRDFQENICYLDKTIVAVEPSHPFTKEITRSDYGLPEGVFVFCCMARFYRLDRSVLEDWAFILNAVPDSHLWLQTEQPSLKKMVWNYFKENGIEPSRIVFAPEQRLTQSWHHRLADLWLDSHRFTSGTSCILALKAGLPCISLLGNKPQSRLAATLLQAANMPEWIAYNRLDYRQKAIDLALNPEVHAASRIRLLQQRHESPLFQPRDFVRDLEKVYFYLLKSAYK